MASDIRFGQPGCEDRLPVHAASACRGADMGACAILPRIIGHGRAAELLFTGRDMTSDEGLAWGFYNRVVDDVLAEAHALARELAHGPDDRPCGDQAPARRRVERVASRKRSRWKREAQARCMQTNDFKRAYEAFAAKQTAGVPG